jgi:hypothetical protein
MSTRAIALIITSLILLSVGLAASAAELKTPRQTCTAPDCGATVLFGRLNKSDRCCGFANLSIPWVAQLYAYKSECLRLHVTAQPPRPNWWRLLPAPLAPGGMIPRGLRPAPRVLC